MNDSDSCLPDQRIQNEVPIFKLWMLFQGPLLESTIPTVIYVKGSLELINAQPELLYTTALTTNEHSCLHR